MLRYAARNALLPSVTTFGMALGFVVGGALLTEVVFAYPGIGYQLLAAVQNLDYPLMQGHLPDDHRRRAGRQLPRRHRLRPPRPARARELNGGARCHSHRIPRRCAELGPRHGARPGRPAQAAPPPPTQARRRRGLLRGLLSNSKAVAGLVILAIFLLIALLAPVLAPGDPSLITGMGCQPPSPEHWLGTTAKGQDVLALTIWGARSSLLRRLHRRARWRLLVGLLVGLASAYFGRCVDDVAVAGHQRLPAAARPAAARDPRRVPAAGLGTVILVLVITGWAGSARVLRSQAMSIRGKDFVARLASPASGRSASCSGRSCRTWRRSS